MIKVAFNFNFVKISKQYTNLSLQKLNKKESDWLYKMAHFSLHFFFGLNTLFWGENAYLTGLTFEPSLSSDLKSVNLFK